MHRLDPLVSNRAYLHNASECRCKQVGGRVLLEPSQVTSFLFPFVSRLPFILPLHLFFRRHHRIRNIQEPAELRKSQNVHWMILGTQESPPAITLSFRPGHHLQATVTTVTNDISEKYHHHGRLGYRYLIVFPAHHGTTRNTASIGQLSLCPR